MSSPITITMVHRYSPVCHEFLTQFDGHSSQLLLGKKGNNGTPESLQTFAADTSSLVSSSDQPAMVLTIPPQLPPHTPVILSRYASSRPLTYPPKLTRLPRLSPTPHTTPLQSTTNWNTFPDSSGTVVRCKQYHSFHQPWQSDPSKPCRQLLPRTGRGVCCSTRRTTPLFFHQTRLFRSTTVFQVPSPMIVYPTEECRNMWSQMAVYWGVVCVVRMGSKRTRGRGA